VSHGWRNGLLVAGVGLGLLAFAADGLTGSAPGFGLFQGVLLGVGVLLCLTAVLAGRLAANLLLALGGIAVGLVAAELLGRLFFQGQFTSNMRPSPRYLYELIPGSDKYLTRLPVNGGQTHLIHINRSGYRGAELRPRGESRRIVVYGDSFIEGEFSDLDSTFVRRLEQRLAAALQTPLEVVNAGVAGYGPDQESLRMEDELPRLRPDLTIVAIYAGNDFGDLLRNKLYTLGPGGRLELHAVALSDWLAMRFRLGQPGGSVLLKAVRKEFLASVPDTMPTDYVRRWLEQKRRTYEESLAPGPRVVNTFLSPYDIDVSTDPESPASRYQKALLRAVLTKMRSTAEQHGGGLLLLIIPSPTDLCEACGFGRIDSTQFPAYRRAALTDAVQEIALDEHIPFVNLLTPEWSARASELYFRGGDGHWNDQGQDVAAEIVAGYITTHGLLSPMPEAVHASSGTAGTRR
jgi:lysophospholipase L1-like esterase